MPCPALIRRLLAHLAWLLPAATGMAHADAAGPRLESVARHFLEEQLAAPGRTLTVRVSPANAQLPPCADPQPFLPQPATRLPGRVAVGIRCAAAGTRYLQASVAISAPYVVTARALAAGEVLSGAMLETRQGDLAGLPRNAILDPADAIGRQLNRALPAGSAVPANVLRAVPLITRGATVRVEARASGFVVSRDGAAMDGGGLGETIRVRMDNGEVIRARIDGPNLLAVEF